MRPKKIYALLYDIRQQKQSIEFKDGIFFNGIDNMSIRVGEQNPKTKLLTDILIYDTRNPDGDMTTTVADSVHHLSDDKKYLLVTLYNGETYEESRNYTWFDNSTLRHHIFDVQNGVIPLAGFDFERSDMSLFNSNQTKNTRELMIGIDSLRAGQQRDRRRVVQAADRIANLHARQHDSFGQHSPAHPPKSFRRPGHNAKNERTAKERALRTGYFAGPFRTGIVLFRRNHLERRAGAALQIQSRMAPQTLAARFDHDLLPDRRTVGCDYPKGGLGMPIVVSVSFFVIYYIITITGEKMAKEGTWGSFAGMWIAIHPAAHFGLPDLQGHQRLQPVQCRMVHAALQKTKSIFQSHIRHKTEKP